MTRKSTLGVYESFVKDPTLESINLESINTMSDPYVSLASSTSTAIETASKHNLQCRMSTDHIMQWVQDSSQSGEGAQSILKKDKMSYCMHKNDIVVGVRQGWSPDAAALNKAYPHVITTYNGMSLAAQYWLMRLYNNSKSARDIRFYVHEQLKHVGTNPELKAHERQQIDTMPQFYFQGVALGVAHAHPDSGDTVGTVMIGGLRTVLNGHFSVNTGMLVQWYFEFEAPCFRSDGRRIFANKELPAEIEVLFSFSFFFLFVFFHFFSFFIFYFFIFCF